MSEADAGGEEPLEGVDMDTPVEDLDDERLADLYRELAGLLDRGYAPHIHEWHEDAHERKSDVWQEIRSRTDVEEPECPECGARHWGQAPGDPVYCCECYTEGGHDIEVQVHDVWDAMMEEVSADE